MAALERLSSRACLISVGLLYQFSAHATSRALLKTRRLRLKLILSSLSKQKLPICAQDSIVFFFLSERLGKNLSFDKFLENVFTLSKNAILVDVNVQFDVLFGNSVSVQIGLFYLKSQGFEPQSVYELKPNV